MKQKTAIVGFGCAGYHAVKAMRENGYRGLIDVYTDTAWTPGNPMLTTYYIYGKISKEGTCPFGTIEAIQKEFDLQVIFESVDKVLSEEKAVRMADGTVRKYDQILISTGANAFVPPISGTDGKNVFPMRTMRDAKQVKHVLEAEQIKSAVVIGASMVGIKLVELFHARGIHCTLVDMAPYIFPVSAVPQIAHEIEERLQNKGVDLAFSKTLQAVEEEGGQKKIIFADGQTMYCDLVMMCIGTRANTRVADEKIVMNRGIVVDTSMRTNMPDIYCAGDCSEGINLQSGQTQIIGIWDNAARQGETAGANMAGVETVYNGNMLHNITHFMGMDFIGYGDVRMEGEEFEYENKEKGQRFVVRMKEGVPVCMNFLDSYGASGVLKAYMLKKMAGNEEGLSPVARVRLKAEGVPERLINLLMKEKENGQWEK
ncbi:NAD(P)/FAD-dependent oxidoreductase [Faecalicatena acetigenes]|uniref:NAD(P)/FAD-dependent oxidoreductase n=1 Tax=Faecalicatena acetigenes TaxID=2981790 RepID=A0ABT2TCE3_9FIRM|nr:MULTISPECIES: NAD(P)/FAD-dependent oxidoreductase [Lachnospiraceae]MCU6747932.1 NAD(P)/FAD-dependent oxidoreductase [Faecalicatena acetigenes]SCI17485.1 Rubredoxin-NAD(+) reductase [uncultured Clostridium sp.]